MTNHQSTNNSNRYSGSEGSRYSQNDALDIRARRRREANRRKKQAQRRRRNRIIIVLVLLMLVISLVFIVALITKSCSSGNAPVETQPATVTSQPETEPPTQKPTQNAFTEAKADMPAIADNGAEGYLDNSIYIWQNMGFELFYGTNEAATDYAQAISSYKEKLGKDITVYNTVVPNHTELGLPQRLGDGLTSSQRENITTVYTGYTADVKPVDVYNALGTNRDKYIYFNTDHHWTGLGAYYAYTAFAKSAGLQPMTLDETTKQSITGFEGSLYRQTNGNSDLAANLDTVEYFNIPGDFNVSITDKDGNTQEGSLYYENAEAGDNTYGVFLWGDNPYTKIVNTQAESDRKICIIKESYGNAFVPYVCANYKEVYVLDFRYYTGDLKQLCAENGISEVLYINGVMSANSAFQIEKMDALIK